MSAVTRLYLIGGGRNEASYVRTYWRFVRAATKDERRSIAIVVPVTASLCEEGRKVHSEDARDPFAMFDSVKDEQCHLLFASQEEPLTAARLAAVEATAVYVAGGGTRACHDALCTDRSWIAHVREGGLAYCGHEAGAVLASERALMGGWLLALQHTNVEVAPEKCNESLDFAELGAGAGLVPFTIEARATQAGTLARLVQLAAEGVVPGGWAIDENNMLEIDGDELRVHGPNSAYRVRRVGDGSVRTDVFHAGAVLSRADWT